MASILFFEKKVYCWFDNRENIEIYDAVYYTPNDFFLDRTDPSYSEKDRDSDTISDYEEFRIAWYFRPYLSFENNMYENALRPGEPLVLFQVQSVPPEEILGGDNPEGSFCVIGGDYENCRGIVVNYIMLWQMDGGPGSSTTHIPTPPFGDCGSCHRGDAQNVNIWLRSEDGGRTWKVESAKNGWATDCFYRDYNGLDKFEVHREADNSYHLVIYYSAGKHHQYFSPGDYCYFPVQGCEYFNCTDCTERILGEDYNKNEFLPLDIFNVGERWLFVREDDPDFVYNDENNRLLESYGFYNDLNSENLPVRFPQEYVWGPIVFCGGLVHTPEWCGSEECASVIADSFLWKVYSDPDWDGVSTEDDNCSGTWNPNQENGDGDMAGDVCDLCPLDYEIVPLDSDLDGVGDDCDLCPHWGDINIDYHFYPERDRDGDTIANECDLCPDSPGERDTEEIYSPGALDRDRDRVGDRCDNCPDTPNTSQANCNKSYEENYGFEYRGDACDPDPCVEVMSLQPTSESYESVTYIGYKYNAGFQLKGYPWNPETGMEYPDEIRREALEVLWCSPWDYRNNSWDIENLEIYCGTDGHEHKFWNNDNQKSGWWGILGDVTGDGNVDAELQYFDSHEIWASPIQEESYRRSNPQIKTYTIHWLDERVTYPSETDEDYYNRNSKSPQILTYWFRPLNSEKYFSSGIKEPPVSSRSYFRQPDGTIAMPADWNNTYLPPRPYSFIVLSFGTNDLENALGIADIKIFSKIHFPGEFPHVDLAGYERHDECPSYPPWWDYQERPQDCAICGLPILSFEPVTRNMVNFVASLPYENEVPVEKEMAYISYSIPSYKGYSAPETADSIIFAFGGIDGAGRYSNKLWMATKGLTMDGDGESYRWRRIDGVGAYGPQGRMNAGLFIIPTLIKGGFPPVVYTMEGENSPEFPPELYGLIVFGGENGEGYLNDGWKFDPSSYRWYQVSFNGNIPSPRSEFVYDQYNDEVFIYGGKTNSGISSEIYKLNVTNMNFELLSTGEGGPGSRLNSSIAYDNLNNKIYIYGGYDGQSLRNDLWSFDLSTMSFKEEIPDCIYGECPPLTLNARIISVPDSGIITLLTFFAEGSKDLYWIPSDGNWIGERALKKLSTEGDCDGDGLKDEGYGELCKIAQQWWSYPGRKVCDTFSSTLVCAPYSVELLEEGRIKVSGINSFDIKEELVYVTRGNRLEVYNISTPARISLVSFISLPDHPRDVTVMGNFALVSSGYKIFVFDFTNPSSPVLKSTISTCGEALEFAKSENRVSVLSKGGVGILKVIGGKVIPEGFLRISSTGAGFETSLMEMSQCENLSKREQDEFDSNSVFRTAKASIAMNGDIILTASERNLLSIRVASLLVLSLGSSINLSAPVSSLRYDWGYAYANLENGMRLLIKIEDAFTMSIIGEHDINYFDSKLLLEKNKVAMIEKPFLKVAKIVIPPGGAR